MKPSRGYYCIIQYCPDLARLEAANIGVLLFCPERDFLQARMSGDNARIRHFFSEAPHDWIQINAFKNGLIDRLDVEREEIRTLEALETFIGRRANQIQISPPRPMKVTDPSRDLDQLYADLVGGRARHSKGQSLSGFLRKKFVGAGLDRKIRENIRVTVPVSQREIELPFGFQNGRFNLIQVARFEAEAPERAKDTACRYAVEGQSLYENPDPTLGPLQLILVGRFRSVAESRPGVERILEAHKVRLYASTEVDRLVDEIRRTARALPESEPV
ncbi:DUF3037 domain-containing protein [Aquisphaera insulae]|uniref:DUF3037 domain-containing protein n=1 Tax=Aquisphaera insulae TaxID=2712864 RepID=UPI0013EA9636|nr:DUF3037 domain-containing protein [Aquisphaera insulae]